MYSDAKKSRWKRKDKSTYRFKHEWLFKGLVFVAIFTLRLNSGACNGVLHPKSSPSANLTIEIRGYIKTADSKLPTLTLEDNVKLPTTAPGAGYGFPTRPLTLVIHFSNEIGDTF